ncbi:MAG: hypothetical protein HYY46_03020 [Deltaproteobacteria bacterium]|nr:hypothetical protein [Deltaproteobacteria bacterium]
MAALNLAALEDASRALDTLALALMQSLGDWHVLDAVCKAAEPLQWIKAELPEDQTAEATKLAEFLPAVDLFELLERTHQELTEKIEGTPEDYGQRRRVKHLADLTEKAVNFHGLTPVAFPVARFACPTSSEPDPSPHLHTGVC